MRTFPDANLRRKRGSRRLVRRRFGYSFQLSAVSYELKANTEILTLRVRMTTVEVCREKLNDLDRAVVLGCVGNEVERDGASGLARDVGGGVVGFPRGAEHRTRAETRRWIDAAERDRLFAEMAERQARFMFRVAHGLLRSVQDAEDAVQEALLKLYRTDGWLRMEDEKAFLARTVWRGGLMWWRGGRAGPEVGRRGGAGVCCGGRVGGAENGGARRARVAAAAD